jgi:hypothetical protein
MASPVLERLLDDDVVHEQLGDAARRLRDAVVRARGLPAGKAVQDKKIYDGVREAVGGVAAALRRVEEPPKTHRLRTLLLALAAGGVAAAAANRLGG